MSTIMLQKLKKELKKELKQELMREFVAPLLREIKDPEGEYHRAFIKRILKAEKEKSQYLFDSNNFLKTPS